MVTTFILWKTIFEAMENSKLRGKCCCYVISIAPPCWGHVEILLPSFQTGFLRLARPATLCLMATNESHTTPNKDNLLIWPFVIFYISPGNHKSGHSACTDAKRGNLGPIVCLARAPMIATPSCSHWFCWHFWGSLPVSKLEKRVELLTHNN